MGLLNSPATLLLVALIGATLTNQLDAVGKREQSSNFFDPIFGFDEVDAQTVPAPGERVFESSASRRNQPATSSRAFDSSRPTALDDGDGGALRTATQTGGRPAQGSPAATRATIATAKANPPPKASTTIVATTQVTKQPPQQLETLAQHKASVSRRQIIASTIPNELVQTRKRAAAAEQPRHWSALENYYEKLARATGQQQLSSADERDEQNKRFYQLLLDSNRLDEQSLAKINKLPPIYAGAGSGSNSDSWTSQQSKPPVVFTGGSLDLAQLGGATKSQPPFFLPIQNSSPAQSEQSLYSTIKQAPYAATAINQPSSGHGLLYPLQVPSGTASSTKQSAGHIIGSTAPGNSQYLLRDYLLPPPSSQQANYNVQQSQFSFGSGSGDQLATKAGLAKLPEGILLEMRQRLLKHQQETFGSWYDVRSNGALLQEETYCNLHNFGTVRPARVSAKQLEWRQLAESGQQRPISEEQLLSATSSGSGGASLVRDATEFPSHMGIYNSTSQPLGDDSFLCAATWINEKFALTVASCFKNVLNLTSLTVRTGEWNLNRNDTLLSATNGAGGIAASTAAQTMATRQIAQVHLFPRYQFNSSEHNLALIEFDKPISLFELPYILPACQSQTSTGLLRAGQCFAPIRNSTFEEYFDAEGEGETKLRRSVKMVEAPIKLVAANNEPECRQQTGGFEYFKLMHPNYICSASYKQAAWRQKLNQTENFGSGIYCNENGILTLVSLLHPVQLNSSAAFGYLDLSYYRPWMRNVISGRTY